MAASANVMMLANRVWQPTTHRGAHIRRKSCHPLCTQPSLCRVLSRRPLITIASAAASEPLDLTQENVERALLDARSDLLQLFDTSVGITGVAELADLDGPFLKLRLQGRFWHQRSLVLARLANYLQQRIPEIVDVQIEDESQLDDSAANFGHS